MSAFTVLGPIASSRVRVVVGNRESVERVVVSTECTDGSHPEPRMWGVYGDSVGFYCHTCGALAELGPLDPMEMDG